MFDTSNEPVAVLKILNKGMYCALQDAGRFGYRHLGVPCSGAMDRYSLLYVNNQLNNHVNASVLEVAGNGFTFITLTDVLLFFSGASCEITIDSKMSDSSALIKLNGGQTLKIEKINVGARVYIGIKGGFCASPVMDSISTLEGTHLRELKINEFIFSKNISLLKEKISGHLKKFKINNNQEIFVSPGPEFSNLTEDSVKLVLSEHFLITKNSNRMGYRLFGKPLSSIKSNEILTSSVMPGTVQLLPDGQLIALMRDCQTTGGYPRILQIEESGINQLAQRLPGEEVVFQINL